MPSSYKEKLNHIKTLVFDVDGVLTDGSLILLPTGEMTRTMNAKDGYAIRKALEQGLKVAIITGGKDTMVTQRLKYLGIFDIYTGAHPKTDAYEDLLDTYDLQESEVLYMGDDNPDIEVLQRVGLGCCPQDSVPDVRAVAEYISPLNGGKGCVRDIIEQTLKAQGKWGSELDHVVSA